jgi:hypothetical protein
MDRLKPYFEEYAMRSRSSASGLQGIHYVQVIFPVGLICLMLIWAIPGCEEETRHVSRKAETRALDQTGITVGDDDNRRGPEQPRPAIPHSGPIIGRRTTEVRNATDELKKDGAQIASTKIVKKDYIPLLGNAYVSIIGQTSILKIQQAIDIYRADKDRFPKDYDEFMTEIIKANNIALPVLPPHQKYGYDESEHKLIILEYKNVP